LDRKGEEADAGRYYEECLGIVREKVGLSHPMAIYPVKNYAHLLRRQGKADEGVKLFEELLAAQRQRFANREPILLAEALTEYGEFLRRADKHSQAKEPLREALKIYRKNQRGYLPRYYTQCLYSLARLELQDKNFVEAESLAREDVQPTRKQYGEKDRNVAVVLGTQGAALVQLKKYAEAERILLGAMDIFSGNGGEPILSKLSGLLRPQSSAKEPDTEMVEALTNLVRLYRESGRPDKAVEIAVQRSKYWPNNPGQLYEAARDVAQCIPVVAEQQSERQRYTMQALDMIRQALRNNFKDLDQLRNDKRLDSLRSNADFHKLLDELDGRRQDKRP
jgi:tetratricopeptide (TPR) repeat protein